MLRRKRAGPPGSKGLLRRQGDRLMRRGWLAQGLAPRSCREGPGYPQTADSAPSFLVQAAAGH